MIFSQHVFHRLYSGKKRYEYGFVGKTVPSVLFSNMKFSSPSKNSVFRRLENEKLTHRAYDLIGIELGAGIACWLERRTRIEKLRVRITVGEFSSPASTLCAASLFGVRSIPVLPQWHVQDTGHSAKSAGGRLHAYTLDPTKSEWAD